MARSHKGLFAEQGCVVIAEIGQAHDGSLGLAHAHVDAVARAGAHAVKFQTHIADAETTPLEPWRVKFSVQDPTRYDYWKRMEFTEPQWVGLREHAEAVGLYFLSSPFSLEAVELLERVGVAGWKVASGEVTNLPLLERIAKTGLPVILSSGMSSLEHLDQAVALVRSHTESLAILQCTSAYPCAPEQVGLNILDELRQRYSCRVGLSDHSGTIYAGLAAAALHIDVLEVHITLSREMFGPDVPASITTSELRLLVDGINFIERALANPVDKDVIARDMEPLRQAFTKSVVAARDLAPGSTLKVSDLALKKPGTGLPPDRLSDVIGMRLRRPVRQNQQVREQDLESES